MMLRQSFLYVGIFVLACFMLPRVSERRDFRRKVYRPLLSSFLTLCDLWRRAARNYSVLQMASEEVLAENAQAG